MVSPRKDALSWDVYFMAIAQLSAQRSKDPSTQVGACIADKSNRIVATGYNGFPRGVSNIAFPWDREGDPLNTKYMYMCHAEANAIDNRGSNSLENCKMYVTLYPCNECAKRIIQNGITDVIFLSNKYKEKDPFIASFKMFNAAHIAVRPLDIDKEIVIKLKGM